MGATVSGAEAGGAAEAEKSRIFVPGAAHSGDLKARTGNTHPGASRPDPAAIWLCARPDATMADLEKVAAMFAAILASLAAMGCVKKQDAEHCAVWRFNRAPAGKSCGIWQNVAFTARKVFFQSHPCLLRSQKVSKHAKCRNCGCMHMRWAGTVVYTCPFLLQDRSC